MSILKVFCPFIFVRTHKWRVWVLAINDPIQTWYVHIIFVQMISWNVAFFLDEDKILLFFLLLRFIDDKIFEYILIFF